MDDRIGERGDLVNLGDEDGEECQRNAEDRDAHDGRLECNIARLEREILLAAHRALAAERKLVARP